MCIYTICSRVFVTMNARHITVVFDDKGMKLQCAYRNTVAYINRSSQLCISGDRYSLSGFESFLFKLLLHPLNIIEKIEEFLKKVGIISAVCRWVCMEYERCYQGQSLILGEQNQQLRGGG
jgi:hypothetical protein